MTRDETAVDDALLADAVGEAPIGVTIADLRADDEPLVYVNDAFERITGYDRADVLGRNCRFLQGDETDPAAVAEMREAIDAREATSVELLNYRRDGTSFWNLVDIAPIERDGEVTHYVGFQQDVTARVQAEEDVKAERSELELLTRVVRHDIRNDMTVVGGWAEQLARDVDDEQREHVNRIIDRANHVTELTETVGDLVETLVDGEDMSLEPTSLSDVVTDEVSVLRETYSGERTLDVRVRGVPEVDVLANQMLSSVVGNLLSNAVRHNPADDPTVLVTGSATDDRVTLAVSDDGPGVPPERRDAVFGRGEKGLESPGTGIGLYLVDRLVDGYGGSVTVDDSELGGARFEVQLQRA